MLVHDHHGGEQGGRQASLAWKQRLRAHFSFTSWRQRENKTGSDRDFGNIKAHLQRHTSSNKATASNSSQLLRDQAFKYMILRKRHSHLNHCSNFPSWEKFLKTAIGKQLLLPHQLATSLHIFTFTPILESHFIEIFPPSSFLGTSHCKQDF